MKIMETLKKAVVLVPAALALIACRKVVTEEIPWTDDGTPVGTWSLSFWSGLSQLDVYCSFSDDGSFELYQRLSSIYFEYYDGEWEFSDDNVLSGTYSDGEEWRASYYVAFRDGEMRFINVEDEDDVAYYVTSSIPDDVIELVNIGSKASEDSETSTGLLRNSGRFL